MMADGRADADCAFKRSAMADIETGYRTDLGRASNAPRLDAREEGGLSACSERLPENRPRAETGANRGMTVGRKPASIGRLRAGRPETRVNSGLAGRLSGNARKHWAGGQGLRKRPFYAGFKVGVVIGVVVIGKAIKEVEKIRKEKESEGRKAIKEIKIIKERIFTDW